MFARQAQRGGLLARKGQKYAPFLVLKASFPCI